jgi:hypothetical protein
MYTNKERARVVIFTAEAYRVEGDLHILVGSRLTDALNSKSKDFFAVTDARILALESDRVLYEASYVAVNRESISCILPLEDSPSGE